MTVRRLIAYGLKPHTGSMFGRFFSHLPAMFKEVFENGVRPRAST
ncbi:MAG: hypothetical protein QXR26_04470 [Candidatus Caldarchaeum sp.]